MDKSEKSRLARYIGFGSLAGVGLMFVRLAADGNSAMGAQQAIMGALIGAFGGLLMYMNRPEISALVRRILPRKRD